MSETPQGYDTVRTLTTKVGGADVRSTLMRLLKTLQDFSQLAGPDGIVTVTINAHVPSRRLPSATPDTTG